MNSNYCLFYVAGLLGAFAYDDISRNKFATQSNTYADTKQYDASNAVDGNTTTCMRTKAIGKSSPYKTMWWKVDFGGVFNIYRINILFKKYDESDEIRQRGRFAGFSLFVSKTGDIQSATLCYKDGPQLPFLNFTSICTESARYVIFYNERLDGDNYPNNYEVTSVFTELCEVTVQGCNNASFYGSKCDTPCPSNCKDSTCHIQNGTCFKCKPGWAGMYCYTKCKEGWYGDNCTEQCVGHCKTGSACNHVTGQCDGGCDAGWTDFMCDKGCDDGTYGYKCTNNCSGNCLNGSPCNKRTGYCDEGCKPGYINGSCNKVCPSGHYGINCRERCSGHCIHNEPCDQVTGDCSSGCHDGFIGTQCIKSCTKGYFGTNCLRKCSPNCKPDTCRHTDGSCSSCAAGWTGFNCTTACNVSLGVNCQNQCNIHCINKTCDRIDGSCLYGCEDGHQCVDDTTTIPLSLSDNLPAIVGGTVGACVTVTIGIVLALFVIRLKGKSKSMAKRQSFMLEVKPLSKKTPKTELSELPNEVVESTYALPEKTKRGPPTNKNIPVRNMKAQITNMSLNENAGFKSEYHDIPRGELHPCLEGKKQENKVKNRYTTIFPYDHSRVILKTAASNEGGYINANYIEDTRERRTYIATQGPKPKTIADFWTMIWQEEVCNVVCLTNLTSSRVHTMCHICNYKR